MYKVKSVNWSKLNLPEIKVSVVTFKLGRYCKDFRDTLSTRGKMRWHKYTQKSQMRLASGTGNPGSSRTPPELVCCEAMIIQKYQSVINGCKNRRFGCITLRRWKPLNLTHVIDRHMRLRWLRTAHYMWPIVKNYAILTRWRTYSLDRGWYITKQ